MSKNRELSQIAGKITTSHISSDSADFSGNVTALSFTGDGSTLSGIESYDSAKVTGQIDSAAVKLTTNQTVAGIKTFSDSAQFNSSVNFGGTINERGVDSGVSIGIQNDTPRIIFHDPRGTGDHNWEIDHDNGTLRFIKPGALKAQLDSDGNFSCVSITETSSIRYKENVRDLTDTVIPSLRPVIYDRKDGSNRDEVGLIAEEVSQVVPEVVKFDNLGREDGINYTRLIPYLIDHIQKLEKRVEELENGNPDLSDV